MSAMSAEIDHSDAISEVSVEENTTNPLVTEFYTQLVALYSNTLLLNKIALENDAGKSFVQWIYTTYSLWNSPPPKNIKFYAKSWATEQILKATIVPVFVTHAQELYFSLLRLKDTTPQRSHTEVKSREHHEKSYDQDRTPYKGAYVQDRTPYKCAYDQDRTPYLVSKPSTGKIPCKFGTRCTNSKCTFGH